MPGRVLIVSPHFPPVNAPDHQRVRMALPYFHEFGWKPHILAVEPRFVEGFRDEALLATLSDDVPITRVAALPARLTRLVGLGSLGLRAVAPLGWAGDRLLRSHRFDAVFFSTTIFSTMNFGPTWKRRWHVPYVLDMQDPWINDYYRRTNVRPPGGWIKYGFAQWLARRGEPRAMRGAAHILSVSPSYPEMLRARYPDLPGDRFTVLPFGASERDVEIVQARDIRHSIFDPADGFVHWSYLGRGGADMAVGLRALFMALRRLRETEPRIHRLRLHFVGTSYAAKGRAVATVEPLAREEGVGDLVTERTDRIPYLEGLSLLRSSDAILVIGSDDPSYSASKVYPCILAGKPLLAILHRASLAGQVIEECRAGTVVAFASSAKTAELAVRIEPALLQLLALPRGARAATDWQAFAPYTARAMTRQLGAVFDRVAGGNRDRQARSLRGGAFAAEVLP